MRRLLLLPLFLLPACGDQSESPPPPSPTRPEKAAPAPPPATPAPPPSPRAAGPETESEDAAAALRDYYRLIEAGRYDEAWRMRSGEAGRAEFAESFRRYRSHKATVGTPSLKVESGGWAYVEVPVQIFGTLMSGEPVATAGSVTMRRATTAAGDRRWHVHAR